MSRFRNLSMMVVLALVLLSSSVTVGFARQANGSSSSSSSLSVTISSPSAHAVFNRGESVTITASVTHGGSAVSGAAVTATNPTGVKIAVLQTTTPGTYSGQYTVVATDPVGDWTISVQAISGGQVGSAQVSVSVSASLAVSFVSPPTEATMFNVGESAAVKATVTYQDGSPIPSAAVVSFAKPSGGSVSMTIDPTDSSGKTWTGTYAILPSDVPADGISWPITVTATSTGNTGSAVRSVTLFDSLVVGVSTFGSSAYGAPQTSFKVGQTVYVKATVGLHGGTVVSSGTVSLMISGTTIFSTEMPMTYALSTNSWTGSYAFQSSDQQGTQTVTVSAADARGNTGSGIQQITLGIQNLSVSITSPSSGSVFNRGQVVTISASVTTAGGAPATSATVTASTPSGGTISLTNMGSGTYSSRYTIFSTDTTGTWLIAVHASQGGASGSSQVAATVSNQLQVAISTWSSSSFSVPQTTFSMGQTVFVEAKVSLQSGATVPTGTFTFVITGTSAATSRVAMTFSTSLNAWVGSYTVIQGDKAGTQVVMATASDGNGNSGSGARSIRINAAPTPQQPPLEATITLDPTSQDIRVSAVCNTGCVGPTTTSVIHAAPSHPHGKGGANGNDNQAKDLRTYVVTDSAGHSLTLNISVKEKGHEVNAQVLSIQYGNAAPVTKLHDKLSFQYSLSRDGSLRTLEESVKANGTAHIQAHFDAKKDITRITTGPVEPQGQDDDYGARTHLTENGLWLVELVTSNGGLSTDYLLPA